MARTRNLEESLKTPSKEIDVDGADTAIGEALSRVTVVGPLTEEEEDAAEEREEERLEALEEEAEEAEEAAEEAAELEEERLEALEEVAEEAAEAAFDHPVRPVTEPNQLDPKRKCTMLCQCYASRCYHASRNPTAPGYLGLLLLYGGQGPREVPQHPHGHPS